MLQRRFRLMELLECGGMEVKSVLLLLNIKCYTWHWINVSREKIFCLCEQVVEEPPG